MVKATIVVLGGCGLPHHVARSACSRNCTVTLALAKRVEPFGALTERTPEKHRRGTGSPRRSQEQKQPVPCAGKSKSVPCSYAKTWENLQFWTISASDAIGGPCSQPCWSRFRGQTRPVEKGQPSTRSDQQRLPEEGSCA